MENSTIAIYCFIDDFCKKMYGNKKHHNSKMTDSQVISTLIIAALHFGGNHKKACEYMKEMAGFDMPDKSNFNRKVHALKDILDNLFMILAAASKELNLQSNYIIDSFPVPVCHKVRATTCKLFNDKSFCGKNASKKEEFYGLKVHMICTNSGHPVEFVITQASMHDSKAAEIMHIDLAPNSRLYADAAYIDKEFKSYLAEFQQVDFKYPTRKNMKEQLNFWQRIEVKIERKSIESFFAAILRLFPRKIHAVTYQGFLLKLTSFIIAYSFSLFV